MFSTSCRWSARWLQLFSRRLSNFPLIEVFMPPQSVWPHRTILFTLRQLTANSKVDSVERSLGLQILATERQLNTSPGNTPRQFSFTRESEHAMNRVCGCWPFAFVGKRSGCCCLVDLVHCWLASSRSTRRDSCERVNIVKVLEMRRLW